MYVDKWEDGWTIFSSSGKKKGRVFETRKEAEAMMRKIHPTGDDYGRRRLWGGLSRPVERLADR